MLAVLYGHADAVGLLLASGADANAADANGTTPLQAALARNRSDMIEALRRAGAR
jgi:ankyrin repeat protein